MPYVGPEVTAPVLSALAGLCLLLLSLLIPLDMKLLRKRIFGEN